MSDNVHRVTQQQPDPASPDDIRAAGYMVAAHNDYMQNGVFHTFWLFTRPLDEGGAKHAAFAYSVKGEGTSDGEALNQIRQHLRLPLRGVK